LKTSDAVSPVAASQVGTSLVAFVLVYSLLGLAAFLLMARAARKGPPKSVAGTTAGKGYDMLETIWFLLWGILWAVYFMLDGFDLGLGTLLPFLGKSDTDRRIIYNAMGPFWDGNEVWLITAGGVTFAAFSRDVRRALQLFLTRLSCSSSWSHTTRCSLRVERQA